MWQKLAKKPVYAALVFISMNVKPWFKPPLADMCQPWNVIVTSVIVLRLFFGTRQIHAVSLLISVPITVVVPH